MIRSLVYHLQCQIGSLQDLLQSLRKAGGNGYKKPKTETLLEMFLAALMSTDRKVYLILDALDEHVASRQKLLAWVEMMAKLTSPKIHLLVTSREESDISLVLRRTNLIGQIIAVQTDIIEEDIRAYIDHRLRTDGDFVFHTGIQGMTCFASLFA